jgi:hypothetical protein
MMMQQQMMMQPQVVGVVATAPPEKKWIKMGPLWDNNDARNKAHGWEAQNPGWRWTGEWRTTIPNEQSEIEVTNQF